MARMKRLLEDDANRISDEIKEYLENCPHDISPLFEDEEIEKLSWALAYDNYESKMEDMAEGMREDRISEDCERYTISE